MPIWYIYFNDIYENESSRCGPTPTPLQRILIFMVVNRASDFRNLSSWHVLISEPQS